MNKRQYFACVWYPAIVLALNVSVLGAARPIVLRPAQQGIVSDFSANVTPVHSTFSSRTTPQTVYDQLPVGFELNKGQTDRHVKFLAHMGQSTLFLTPTEAVIALAKVQATAASLPPSAPREAVRQGLVLHPQPEHYSTQAAILSLPIQGTNPHPQLVGLGRLPGATNYFIGRAPRHWHTDIPSYAAVAYRNVYPGIDVLFSGNQGQVEYRLSVRPEAGVDSIRRAREALQRLQIDAHGALQFSGVDDSGARPGSPMARVAHSHPLGTGRQAIDAAQTGRRGPSTQAPRRASGINSIVDYATYLGGRGSDSGQGIAVDAQGNAYVTGWTNSVDFPSAHTLRPSVRGGDDIFVTKVTADGRGAVYSTYLGGSGTDRGAGIAVDPQGEALITGYTKSTDFPTVHALQGRYGGSTQKNGCYYGCGDAFVAKLNTTGDALLYSTYLGGRDDDFGAAIAVDAAGHAYVTGGTYSNQFPLVNPLQATYGGDGDAFVAKLGVAGNTLAYSTYFGGRREDIAAGIAVDGMGDVAITGNTSSKNLPTAHAFQPTCHACSDVFSEPRDAFVAKLNPTGRALVYSTYAGGRHNLNDGTGIAVDTTGDAYVTGDTYADDFPTTGVLPGAPVQRKGQTYPVAIALKLDPVGRLLYSVKLGGIEGGFGTAIAVDSAEHAYVLGTTSSTDFPSASETFGTCQSCGAGEGATFVAKLNAQGQALDSVAYVGSIQSIYPEYAGIALTATADIYLTGGTSSKNIATLNAIQGSYGGGASDAVVMKLKNPATPSAPPTVIVLISGVLSHTGDGYFDGFENIVGKGLQRAHVPNVTFLRYSYTGGRVDQLGAWHPNTFKCQDTFVNSLNHDVVKLSNLIMAYLTRHSNADVYLVGHSQGGLIAFSYLASLRRQHGLLSPWAVPNGGHLRGITTMDSPLAGIPNATGISLGASFYNLQCRAMRPTPHRQLPYVSLAQMYAIAQTVPPGAHPRGGRASVSEALYGVSQTNQALAAEAAQHGIRVLTLGNTRDYTFVPCPTISGLSELNIDTQWLDEAVGASSGPYGRAVALGSSDCSVLALGANHSLVLTNQSPALTGVVHFLAGASPAPLKRPLPDLALRLTAQQISGVAALRYTIVVRNIGGASVDNVLLDDHIKGTDGPLTMSGQGMTCHLSIGSVVVCTGKLGVYQEATVSITAPASSSGGALTNTAIVDPDNKIEELDESNNAITTVNMVSTS